MTLFVILFVFLFVLFFFYLYLFFVGLLSSLIRFISYHHLVFFYYFLNILIFFVGLNAVFHYNNMTVEDFMNDFKEFKVLYEVFKHQLLPELFPSYYK